MRNATIPRWFPPNRIHPPVHRLHMLHLGIAVLILATMTLGCVRRRMTIRSDPPGAMVAIDQQEIGITPLSVPFTYYGTRNFVVTKDHHETVMASRTLNPPWYEYPPLDFIAENLWPVEVRDERFIEFQLAPKANVAPEKLIGRAQDLRTTARNGVIAPLPSVAVQGAPGDGSSATAQPVDRPFVPGPLAPSSGPPKSSGRSYIRPPDR